MGLFTRKVENDTIIKNAVQVNNVDENAYYKTFSFNFRGRNRKDFGGLFFYTIMEKIFQGLKNVTWRSTEINYLAEDIVNFIDLNSTLLVNQYFKYGYMCVIVDGYDIRFPHKNELKYDSNLRITNKNAVCVYSDPYILERKTHYSLAFPLLEAINNNLNNSDFVTSNLGLFGILSGKGLPISSQAKEEVQEKLRKRYGYGEDKFQFILSNTELDYKPITIPVDQLKLNDNVDFQIKQICRFFGINPDYIYGGSSFSNQSEAVKSFYKSCIMPLAEVMLSLGRNIYIKQNNSDKPSTIITYDLSNIGEFNTTLSDNCAEKSAYLDYLMKLKEAGVDVSEDVRKLYRDSKDLLRNV